MRRARKMRVILSKAIELAAREVVHWAQNAVGDLGYTYKDTLWDSDSFAARKVAELRESGVEEAYIGEALADHMYSDVDTLVDLCGDRIYDEATTIVSATIIDSPGKTHNDVFKLICLEIKSCNGGAMAEAMDKLIERHT
jgi:hypothetical protein